MCFDRSRHAEILKEDNKKIIYEFKNLERDEDDGDYKLTPSTVWEKTTYLNYDKYLRPTNISDITSQVKLYSRVHVECIIYDLHDLKPTRNNIERKIAVFKDTTGFIRCTIFGKQGKDVHEGKAYKMRYLRVTEYQGRRQLSTTDETKICPSSNEELHFVGQESNEIVIENRVGIVRSFNDDTNKPLCPDCYREIEFVSGDRAYCDNPNCETDLLARDSIALISFVNFRLKLDDKNEKGKNENNVDPSVKCDPKLLNKLWGISDGCDTTFVHRLKLIGKKVDISYDVDNFEVIAIKFH